MNHGNVKYNGCTIEKGHNIWFWKGRPYLSVESAKKAIDDAAEALKKSIK